MGGTPVRSSNYLLLPPPNALPITSVRAAAAHQGRESLTAPMLGVHMKSNGMSDLEHKARRALSSPAPMIRVAEGHGRPVASYGQFGSISQG
jgi:hypothetical protein